MAQTQHIPELLLLKEALTTSFCEVDDVYTSLNPRSKHYENLKRNSDSDVSPSRSSSSFEG